MRIALELAAHKDPVYEDIALKFFEHFLGIAKAMTKVGGQSGMHESDIGLWDEDDGFYYDELALPNGQMIPLKVRSLVGLAASDPSNVATVTTQSAPGAGGNGLRVTYWNNRDFTGTSVTRTDPTVNR